jgi:hypothetical protein
VLAICTPNCAEYAMAFHGTNLASGTVTTGMSNSEYLSVDVCVKRICFLVGF